MIEHLSKEFWSDRYKTNQTGWDLGEVSPPIKAYFDQITDKNLKILIPGAGNAYEAEYLHKQGFVNVHVLDLCAEPLDYFRDRVTDFPVNHLHCENFFVHEGQYDIIVEQTLFCAIDPKLRTDYAEKASSLLKSGGLLVGLLFDIHFEDGPPYGGCAEEYTSTFSPYFREVKMEPCYNSVGPRQGNELFIRLYKD